MLREKIDKLIGEARLNKEPKKVLVYQAIKNEFLQNYGEKDARSSASLMNRRVLSLIFYIMFNSLFTNFSYSRTKITVCP